MTKEFIYEKRIVAYIDLLGTEEFVKRRDPKIIDIVNKFASYAKDPTFKEDNLEVTVFSDHIAISFPVVSSNKINLENLSTTIFNILYECCAYAFLKELLLRGSVAIGDLYHKDQVIVGQALVDAYYLESEHADSPRIILSEELLELINRHTYFKEDGTIEEEIVPYRYPSMLSIKSDYMDPYSYLDWLEWYRGKNVTTVSNNQDEYEWTEKIKHIIKKNLHALENNSGPLEKWKWMATYFNGQVPPTKRIEISS